MEKVPKFSVGDRVRLRRNTLLGQREGEKPLMKVTEHRASGLYPYKCVVLSGNQAILGVETIFSENELEIASLQTDGVVGLNPELDKERITEIILE